MSDKNTIMNKVAKKVYDKISHKETREPIVVDSATDVTDPKQSMVAVVAPVLTPAVASVPEKSWFSQTYSIFGYDLSILTILIIVIVLGAVVYYTATYFGYFGGGEKKEPRIVVEEAPRKVVEEDVEEESDVEEEADERGDGEREEEQQVHEKETCNLKERR